MLFAATDGSSEKNVGAAAVLLPQLGFSAVCGLQGEDQGPYKAELWALRLLLQVILKCDLTGLREIHIFCDCEAAIFGSPPRRLLAAAVGTGTCESKISP